MHIYIDIETIPSQRPEVRERFLDAAIEAARSDPPPANYKHVEAIEKWRDERIVGAEDAGDEDWRRTALDGGYGEIVCVCWAVEDGDIKTLHRTRRHTMEAELLVQLFDALREDTRGQVPSYVGHNIGFDLRFLHHRAVVLGIRPGIHLPYNDPPWRSTYIDTMQEWCGARDRVKLTTLCDMLGIQVDDEIDGSQVWDAWRDGREDQIVEHCRADVDRVRQIHHRLTWR